MRRSSWLFTWAMIGTCLLAGCVLTVDEPFGDPANVRSLEKLVGAWVVDQEANQANVMLIQRDAGGLHTGFVSWQARSTNKNAGQATDTGNHFLLDQGALQLRVVGGATFLFHKPEGGESRDVWSVSRFEQTDDNSFQVFLPDQLALRKAADQAKGFSIREIRQTGKPMELHVEGDLVAFAAMLDADTISRCFPKSSGLRMRRLSIQP